MRNVFLGAVLVALVGCSSSPAKVAGNFCASSGKCGEALASEAVAHLGASFLPAKTALNLTHDASDAFGVELVSALRAKGYAIGEGGDSSGLPLTYIVDSAGELGNYHLTLVVGDKRMSRLFIDSGSALVPAGQWAIKE